MIKRIELNETLNEGDIKLGFAAKGDIAETLEIQARDEQTILAAIMFMASEYMEIFNCKEETMREAFECIFDDTFKNEEEKSLVDIGNNIIVEISSSKGIVSVAHKKENIFDFGRAIQLLKQGKKLQREGWNGKNQYIELATNISYKNNKEEIINAEHDAIGNRAIAFVGTSGVQLGWLASQSDMLAEDWKLVESEEIK